jgi:hypothetical protein
MKFTEFSQCASPGELQSLTEAGIASIDLTPVTGTVAGQTGVKGVVATFTDGSTHTLWDVDFGLSGGSDGEAATTAYSPEIDKIRLGDQVAL